MTFKTAFLSTVAGVAALAGASSALAGDVVVTLTGVQARGGEVLVALQSREQFMQPRSTSGTISAAPSAGVLTVTLRNVPPGDYALTAMHDTNGNRRMDMTSGRPAEGWALSRVPANIDHRPTFDETQIHVGADGAQVSAAMVYPAS